jgi:carbamoyl-phosphate synthase large subunit
VLPFVRLPGSNPVLGPEMHATGEVMATADDLAGALEKAERAAGRAVPTSGSALVCVTDNPITLELARDLVDRGLDVHLWPRAGAPADLAELLPTARLVEPDDASPRGLVRKTGCSLVVATADDDAPMRELRQAAVLDGVPLVTSRRGGAALSRALEAARSSRPLALQDELAPVSPRTSVPKPESLALLQNGGSA